MISPQQLTSPLLYGRLHKLTTQWKFTKFSKLSDLPCINRQTIFTIHLVYTDQPVACRVTVCGECYNYAVYQYRPTMNGKFHKIVMDNIMYGCRWFMLNFHILIMIKCVLFHIFLISILPSISSKALTTFYARHTYLYYHETQL